MKSYLWRFSESDHNFYETCVKFSRALNDVV